MPFDDHRTTPLDALSPWVNALEEGGIDQMWFWDEMSGWYPGDLWRPQNTPLAAVCDQNAIYDPFVIAANALGRSSKLSVRLTADSLRTGPVELLRKLYTMAAATQGRAICAIGAGEIRNIKPFGYRKSEGLSRLEDIMRLGRLLWDAEEPISFEGNHWHLENAFLGAARPERRPELWALGGGPRLIEIAAQYADGFELATPQVVPTPEALAAVVKHVRERVEFYGRDPDQFGFAIWLMGLTHDDPDEIDRVLDNPLLKYFAGTLGRLDQEQWRREGLEPVMPDGWHYALKWLPFNETSQQVAERITRVPKEMVRTSMHCGTPSEQAALCAEFVEAGASFVGLTDAYPVVAGPDAFEGSMRRTLEISTLLKKIVMQA